MFDSDLAALYGVPTRALNQAVSRNASRFPADFAYRLTRLEVANLMSQIVTSSSHGGSRKLPRVFTEQGVAMLSSVLRSRRAIEVNIAIMTALVAASSIVGRSHRVRGLRVMFDRAFVQVRELAAESADLALRIDELEKRYDGQFADVFDAIRELAYPSVRESPRRRIGFNVNASVATSGKPGLSSPRRFAMRRGSSGP